MNNQVNNQAAAVDITTLDAVSDNQATAARQAGELVLGPRVKRDVEKLPRTKNFRIEIKGGSGTADGWHTTGYVVYLRCKGFAHFQEASALAASYGMKIKTSYKTEEDAVAAAWRMLKTWGRPKAAVRRAASTPEAAAAAAVRRAEKRLEAAKAKAAALAAAAAA